MVDAASLAWGMTSLGTLGVAFRIFVGQVIAFTLLLGIAAVAQLLVSLVRLLSLSRNR